MLNGFFKNTQRNGVKATKEATYSNEAIVKTDDLTTTAFFAQPWSPMKIHPFHLQFAQ